MPSPSALLLQLFQFILLPMMQNLGRLLFQRIFLLFQAADVFAQLFALRQHLHFLLLLLFHLRFHLLKLLLRIGLLRLEIT